MKVNYKVFLSVALTAACVASAHGQAPAVAPAPADPLNTKPSTPRTEQRLRAVVAAPGHSPKQVAANDFGGVSYGLSTHYSSSDSVPPVVIQFGAKDGNAIDAMEEDLAIMTRIIDRAVDRLGEETPEEKLGVRMTYTSGGKSVRALYLEGFGPLFMVKVNFPVHSTGKTETKAPEQQQDSEWDIVRRQLYGAEDSSVWVASSSVVPYDAGRVDGLKKHLLEALKNASNMKGVKAEEFVNVTVFGSPAATMVMDSGTGGGAAGGRGGAGLPDESSATRSSTANRNGATQWSTGRSRSVDVARSTLQGTVLTLRAKKSDIDAAAKGSLDDEAFSKKATVSTYSGNGYGLTSVNSWVRKSSSSTLQAR